MADDSTIVLGYLVQLQLKLVDSKFSRDTIDPKKKSDKSAVRRSTNFDVKLPDIKKSFLYFRKAPKGLKGKNILVICFWDLASRLTFLRREKLRAFVEFITYENLRGEWYNHIYDIYPSIRTVKSALDNEISLIESDTFDVSKRRGIIG